VTLTQNTWISVWYFSFADVYVTEQDVRILKRLHVRNGQSVVPGKGLTVDVIVGPKTRKALFD
jgi:hypothetical protein